MEPNALILNEGPRFGGGVTPQQPTYSEAPRRTRSLLLWSGGIDSTYALVKLLRTTTDQVFTHQVHFIDANASCRADYEAQATATLRDCLQEHERAFQHTLSCIDLHQLKGRGMDSCMLAFMAAQAAICHDFTPFDRVMIGVNADLDPGWDPDSSACAMRRARIARALRAAWGCDEVPQVYFCLPRPTRAQMVDFLGLELMAKTVSCTQPVKLLQTKNPALADGSLFDACGECKKCKQRKLSAAASTQEPLNVNGATKRTQHLFHHLEAAQNKKLALQGANATSDQPGP